MKIVLLLITFFVLVLFFVPLLRHGLTDEIGCGDNNICIHYNEYDTSEQSTTTYTQWCDLRYSKGNWAMGYIEDTESNYKFRGIFTDPTIYTLLDYKDKKNYLPDDRLWYFNLNGWKELFGYNITYKACVKT